jgi:hypothetical protein
MDRFAWLRVVLHGCLVTCFVSVPGCGGDLPAQPGSSTAASGSSVEVRATPSLANALGAQWSCDRTTCVNQSNEQPSVEAVFEQDSAQAPPPGTRRADADEGEPVAVTSAALTSAQAVVLGGNGTVEYSEPVAMTYRTDGSPSVMSMNVFANQTFGGGLIPQSTVLAHACTTDYSSWCVRYHTVSSQPKFADPAAIFESVGTNYLHVLYVSTTLNSFAWYSLHDPCPSSCSAQSWTQCSVSPSGMSTVDYPQLIYDRNSDTKWVVYTATPTSTGIPQPALTRLDSCSSSTTFLPTCPYWGLVSLQFPRGAFDSSGNIHLVAFNFGANPPQIFHTTFSTSTNSWTCDYETIDNWAGPAPSYCGLNGSTFKHYNNIGACLKSNWSANIAVDDLSSPNALMVALATQSGSYESALRVYKSTDGGANWSNPLRESHNTYHPMIVPFRNPFWGLAQVFHLTAVWATSGGNAETVRYITANSGASWAWAPISDQRYILPVAVNPSGYWGDYEALAMDQSNAGFFYGWGQADQSNGYWDIQGRVININ